MIQTEAFEKLMVGCPECNGLGIRHKHGWEVCVCGIWDAMSPSGRDRVRDNLWSSTSEPTRYILRPSRAWRAPQ